MEADGAMVEVEKRTSFEYAKVEALVVFVFGNDEAVNRNKKSLLLLLLTDAMKTGTPNSLNTNQPMDGSEGKTKKEEEAEEEKAPVNMHEQRTCRYRQGQRDD